MGSLVYVEDNIYLSDKGYEVRPSKGKKKYFKTVEEARKEKALKYSYKACSLSRDYQRPVRSPVPKPTAPIAPSRGFSRPSAPKTSPTPRPTKKSACRGLWEVREYLIKNHPTFTDAIKLIDTKIAEAERYSLDIKESHRREIARVSSPQYQETQRRLVERQRIQSEVAEEVAKERRRFWAIYGSSIRRGRY